MRIWWFFFLFKFVLVAVGDNGGEYEGIGAVNGR